MCNSGGHRGWRQQGQWRIAENRELRQSMREEHEGKEEGYRQTVTAEGGEGRDNNNSRKWRARADCEGRV